MSAPPEHREDAQNQRPLSLKWVGVNGNPLLRTPHGLPDGWFVTIDEDGVPNLERASQPQAERATKEAPDGR